MNTKKKCRYDIVGLSNELDVPITDLKGLYDTYLSELDDQIKVMYDLEKAKDWNMLERTVHNIKGMSATVFVYDVQQEAVMLDNLLKSNIIEDTHKYLESIDKIAREAKKEIVDFFESQNTLF